MGAYAGRRVSCKKPRHARQEPLVEDEMPDTGLSEIPDGNGTSLASKMGVIARRRRMARLKKHGAVTCPERKAVGVADETQNNYGVAF